MAIQYRDLDLFPFSSNDDISQPQLDLFSDQPTPEFHQEPYLYKISALYSEDYDPDFAPVLTSAKELPELANWAQKFAISVLEIWAGKRSPAQLARWCHSTVYAELNASIGYQKEVGRLRKLYIQEPLDGLCESTATVRYNERLRSMTMRFEGVDRRWICTALELI